jgi:uncharacterized alkaline shock family protein YloU
MSKENKINRASNLLGNIYVSYRAIASIAYLAAQETYGVVGLTAKNIAEGLANVIVKDPTLGVDVNYDGNIIKINLYIIIEYGTRITSVANSVASNIQFQVEKAMGLPIDHVVVNIHVRGLRISNTD